ncbi:hypothetical protein [Streptomyces osmaniensis]|uniref:hypothetical protein n=1 Tax=Streptomyces osmaniensis TaxID=593134 RepID=UPI001C3249CD|nr:hypothetical protein KJK32_41665 [Streptomyces sp. JCM17656]
MSVFLQQLPALIGVVVGDRQRAGRADYYAAVREDLGLPHGPSARWPVRTVEPVPPQR